MEILRGASVVCMKIKSQQLQKKRYVIIINIKFDLPLYSTYLRTSQKIFKVPALFIRTFRNHIIQYLQLKSCVCRTYHYHYLNMPFKLLLWYACKALKNVIQTFPPSAAWTEGSIYKAAVWSYSKHTTAYEKKIDTFINHCDVFYRYALCSVFFQDSKTPFISINSK